MNERTEKIVAALDTLGDACGLSRSESSTERLFLTLATAFNRKNAKEMERIRDDSHKEGLCFDMRYPIAEKIEEALDHFKYPMFPMIRPFPNSSFLSRRCARSSPPPSRWIGQIEEYLRSARFGPTTAGHARPLGRKSLLAGGEDDIPL